MLKRWGTIFWVILGAYTSNLFLKVFFKGLEWQWALFIGIIGGWLGYFFYRFVFIPLNECLKKISTPRILIYGFSFCLGLTMLSLTAIAAKPFLEQLSAQTGFKVVLALAILFMGIITYISSLKFKELCLIFFDVPGLSSPKITSGKNQFKILDTSAIIDGRIADLCKTGFLEGVLIIPNFVLTELQKIADSADPLRRNRGRRGLDLLNKIQKENQVTIRIFDRDYEELTDVDTKLLRLARELEAKVITNDFNLNKVAELYGVQVLNINELSNAIKPVVLPGEEMIVRILRDGKEYGQGIGYLEDGTMIVVEG
ncbi:MAG: PIN/TRAM domain-containing protein, partial [Bacillota bacterium]